MKLTPLACELLLCLAAAGCLHTPRIVAEAPRDPSCLSAVTPEQGVAPIVHWRRPSAVNERRALDAQCTTVGPAVVRFAPHAASPAPEAPRLTIVSWNNHVGGGDLTAFVAALRRGEFTGGAPVQDFVLLLQEVYRSGGGVPPISGHDVTVPRRIEERPPAGTRRDIVATAAALELSLYYVRSMRNGRDGSVESAEDRGNAILSTRRLTDFMAIELPFERQRRVALAAIISGVHPDGNTWHLRVVSAHLDAGASAKRLWLFASALRARQAQTLARAFDDDVPTVMGSDLNTWSDGPHEPAVTTLLRAFPDTSAPPMRSTFRSGAAQFALDYMLFRLPSTWQARERRLDNRFGSDHYPLVGLLSIE